MCSVVLAHLPVGECVKSTTTVLWGIFPNTRPFSNMKMRELAHSATTEHSKDTVKKKQTTNHTCVLSCVFRAVKMLHFQFSTLWKFYFWKKIYSSLFLAIFLFCTVMVSTHTTHEPYSHAFTQSNISFYSFFLQDVRGIFKFHIQTLDAEKELEPHTTDFRTACWFKVSLTADRTLQGTSFITSANAALKSKLSK